MVSQLEMQMKDNVVMYDENTNFLNSLEKISDINAKIMELEIFASVDSTINMQLREYRDVLEKEEEKIENISSSIVSANFSKNGLANTQIITKWLDETVILAKSNAELKVFKNRLKYYEGLQDFYSPVGTEIGRRERDISVVEQAYLNSLHHLNLAHQKLNNIKLTSSSLNTVSPATFPLRSDASKSSLYVIFVFVVCMIFIIAIQLIKELLDRTLRDANRAYVLTKLDVIGSFLGIKQSVYRGYNKAINRHSARIMVNKLNHNINTKNTMYINIFSI